MDPKAEQQRHHAPHGLRGPHARAGLTSDERAELRRWLDVSEKDARIGVRELAQYVAKHPLLDNAVRTAAGSALWGGTQPSSTTHAVAMLGIRRTRQLMQSFTSPTDSISQSTGAN